MLRGFEPNLADVSLPDLDDWLTDPLFWFGIVGPALLLAIAFLYFLWIDCKAKKLSRRETKRKISR